MRRGRFEFVYTPKHGSWLNVAEAELSVMIRQCLNRRIDCMQVLAQEVGVWQFTTAHARRKLKRLYPALEG